MGELAPVAWVWEDQLQPSMAQREFLPVAGSSNRESWPCMQERELVLPLTMPAGELSLSHLRGLVPVETTN